MTQLSSQDSNESVSDKHPSATVLYWILWICAACASALFTTLLSKSPAFGVFGTLPCFGALGVIGCGLFRIRARQLWQTGYWFLILSMSGASQFLVSSAITGGRLTFIAVALSVMLTGALMGLRSAEALDPSIPSASLKVIALHWLALGVSIALGASVAEILSLNTGLGPVSGIFLTGIAVILLLRTHFYFSSLRSPFVSFWVGSVLTHSLGCLAAEFLTQPSEAVESRLARQLTLHLDPLYSGLGVLLVLISGCVIAMFRADFQIRRVRLGQGPSLYWKGLF